MRVDIFPLEKLSFNDVHLNFEMSLLEVEELIGKGLFIRDRYYYYDSEVSLSFDHNQKLCFIEILCGLGGKIKPYIYGISAFKNECDIVLQMLLCKNDNVLVDNENGFCYIFEKISVGVYRESIPSQVTEMILEANSFGNPLSEEEIAYERKKANHFATIGFGVSGYYK